MARALNGLEFIVGIPSYMEADSIGYVTQQVDQGLTQYLGNLNTLIVNVDNHSPDNTREAFLRTETQTPKHYISTPKGVRGKGNNFLNLFRLTRKNAETLKGVVVVDADLESITPEWVRYLAEPLLLGYDFVLPYYSRHQFDGSITNHICFPLLYGLLGRNIRQPIGGEFGFSPAMAKYWLDKKWTQTTRQYGIDIFMSLNAILGGFKMCEVGLGAKIHKASAPKLGPMFTQVVNTLFELILTRKNEWLNHKPGVQPIPLKRFGLTKLDPPQDLKIDIRALKHNLQVEYAKREKLLKKYLNDYDTTSLANMFEQDHYYLDILMWTQVVYQLLYIYDTGSPRVKRDIVESLKPLYFARAVSFNYMTWRYSIRYAEQAIEEQAKAFAAQKPYLVGLYSA